MMTASAILYLICVACLGYDNLGVGAIACIFGIAALTSLHFWRLNTKLAIWLPIISLSVILVYTLLTKTHDSLSVHTFASLTFTLVVTLICSFRYGFSRALGAVIGALLGLVWARMLLIIIPSLPGLQLAPYEIYHIAEYVIPAVAGGLLGMDMGAYSELHPQILHNRRFWYALGLAALIGVCLRIYNITSGAYKGYTTYELGQIGNTHALASKIQNAPTCRERYYAIDALPNKVDSITEQAVIDAAKDLSVAVRESAIQKLSAFLYNDFSKRTATAIISSLDDPNTFVRYEAMETIEMYMGDYRNETPAILTDACVTALRNDQPMIKIRAAVALVHTDRKDLYELLLTKLNDPKAVMGAITGLGELRDRRALPYIVPYLNCDHLTSLQTIRAMAKLHDQRAVPYLVKIIRGNRKELWQYAAESAYNLGGQKPATEALMSHLTDKDMDNRLEALDIIGKYGDKSALPRLNRIAKGYPGGPAYMAAYRIQLRMEQLRLERQREKAIYGAQTKSSQ